MVMQVEMVREKRGGRTMLLAVGLVLSSSLLYVLGYSLSKTLVSSYGLSALQVTFLRCLLVLVGSLVLLAWPRSGVSRARLLHPPRTWEQRAAAAALVASNVLAIVAYSLMPVTAASALGFTAPLLLTALGGLLLGERISLGRWLGAASGFAGMLLIVRPGEGGAWPGILAALGAAASYALYQILVRRLRDVANSLDTAVQVAVVGVALLAATMLWFWHQVSAEAFALVLFFTVIQTAALGCIAGALRRGEASRLAPWQFSGLLWAMLIDALLFTTLPSPVSLLGGSLIIAGGLLAHGRERRSA